MLGTVAPTPFDLNFSLFGIPVRVHPFFWIVSAVMGWSDDWALTLIWMLCVFVSILIHEMGHALTADYYGWNAHVVLYSFGGYAQYFETARRSTGRAILVTFAGPAAGFIFYALVFATQKMLENRGVELSPYAEDALYNLEFINLWWGLVNLLPVYPLDGGQISRAALEHWRGREGVALSLTISLIVAGAVAYWMFTHHRNYAGVLFAMLAIENFQSMQGGARYR
jgi:Zn-dependent protease